MCWLCLLPCAACRQAQIGPGQLGLAGGAVLFGLVFLLVSGGDFATTNRYKVGDLTCCSGWAPHLLVACGTEAEQLLQAAACCLQVLTGKQQWRLATGLQ